MGLSVFNRLIRAFARARDGIAAVEFALIAPMVMVLIGSVEIINLVQADRRLENVAASVADVISRDNSIDNTEMNGILGAIEPLMFPDDGTNVDVRITAIMIESTTSAKVIWCDTRGTTFPSIPANEVVAGLPAGMMRAGTSIVRVEVAYPYIPRMGFFTVDDHRRLQNDTDNRNLRHTAYRRSRLVDPIPRDRTS